MPAAVSGVSLMPTYARRQIVVEDEVGVYHCIARCGRRAFLCGVDTYMRQDYSHRKERILNRLRELAGLFAIEVCGYSVMSNHLHLVLRNRPDVAEQWSADEIARRWCRVFPPRDDATGEPGEPSEHDLAMLVANSERLAKLRDLLANLSWFMRCLCEKKDRHHKPGRSRPPSRTCSVASRLPPIQLQSLASPPQSGPCDVYI
jgi:hypothetical protein